jgi:hypothetical protein
VIIIKIRTTTESNRKVGFSRVSRKFAKENIDSFPASRETFSDAYGPEFDTAELDVVNICDIRSSL